MIPEPNFTPESREQARDPMQNAAPSGDDVEKVNILIVDDRSDKLLALESIISGLGQNVVCASSGKEALRCLLKQDFALILLDVNMPGMDGFDTAALIRQRSRNELTPIIFVSAINDAQNHVARGYSLGAVDYILTPIIPEILRAKVGVFVDLYRKTQQIRHQAEAQASLIRAEAARKEAEAARERSAFLAEASNILASSLEYEETFAALAHLLVPRLADCCVVDMLLEDGTVQTVAAVHRDPGMEKAMLDYRVSYPVDPNFDHGVARVLRTGEPEVCSRFDENRIDVFARVPGQAQALRDLEFRAYMILPLRARGRILGAVSILSTQDRVYREGDTTLAGELAQRAALALDNAGLYHAAQEARQQAERANRAKDQFLAMLSHELRTPLSPVLSMVALLESNTDCPAQVRQDIKMIRRNVELEARLIDDLLDLTRVSKGKIQLNFETVDAHALLESALEICRAEIDDKHLEAVFSKKADRSHLRADSARLHQIFWNLIKNAVKFTPEGGRLELVTSNVDSGRLRVEVRDTGKGIEPGLLPRIFNAFEQGEHGRTSGLGLGLTITRALVDLHGGSISAQSNGRDAGSTFIVEFPTIVAPAEPAPAGRDLEKPSEQRCSLRLLMVEDHEDTSRSLQRLLQRRGYEVRTAACVRDAVALANVYDFDVLVSDMGLPDGTGIEVLQSLSQNGAPVKAIALSGFGMEEDLQRSKLAGFQEHLTKPVDINKLDEVIQRVGAMDDDDHSEPSHTTIKHRKPKRNGTVETAT